MPINTIYIISNQYKEAILQQQADNTTNQTAESFSQNSRILVKTTNKHAQQEEACGDRLVYLITLVTLYIISRPIWSCHHSSVLVLTQVLSPAPLEVRWLCTAFRVK